MILGEVVYPEVKSSFWIHSSDNVLGGEGGKLGLFPAEVSSGVPPVLGAKD